MARAYGLRPRLWLLAVTQCHVDGAQKTLGYLWLSVQKISSSVRTPQVICWKKNLHLEQLSVRKKKMVTLFEDSEI